MSSDTVYVLSATHNKGRDTGSMYLKNSDISGCLDELVHDLVDAKVFYSRQDAWNAKEDATSSGWQITPISAKRLFIEKLKGSWITRN